MSSIATATIATTAATTEPTSPSLKRSRTESAPTPAPKLYLSVEITCELPEDAARYRVPLESKSAACLRKVYREVLLAEKKFRNAELSRALADALVNIVEADGDESDEDFDGDERCGLAHGRLRLSKTEGKNYLGLCRVEFGEQADEEAEADILTLDLNDIINERALWKRYYFNVVDDLADPPTALYQNVVIECAY